VLRCDGLVFCVDLVFLGGAWKDTDCNGKGVSIQG